MKFNRIALAALVCTAALGLGACGGDDSGNDDVTATGTEAAESSPEKLDPDADTVGSPSGTANSTGNGGNEGAEGADGEEVTETSPGGAISLTARATPISGPNPKIAVTWEAEPNAGEGCTMILTRTDPRGYLLGVEQLDACTGTHEFTLVHGVAADADDIAGEHVIELDNLDEKATLRVTAAE